jgi:hypothetical protein
MCVLHDVQLELDSNTVKPLSMIPICVIFLQIFIIPSGSKTLPVKSVSNYVRCTVAESVVFTASVI